jgi:hypothetical protein
MTRALLGNTRLGSLNNGLLATVLARTVFATGVNPTSLSVAGGVLRVIEGVEQKGPDVELHALGDERTSCSGSGPNC